MREKYRVSGIFSVNVAKGLCDVGTLDGFVRVVLCSTFRLQVHSRPVISIDSTDFSSSKIFTTDLWDLHEVIRKTVDTLRSATSMDSDNRPVIHSRIVAKTSANTDYPSSSLLRMFGTRGCSSSIII